MSRLITPDAPEPPTSDEQLFGTPKQRLDFYRREIQFELTQLANRNNAHLTAQSFLVIAWASCMANLNPRWGDLFTLVVPVLLALLGVVSSLHAWPGIKASARIIAHWHFKQTQLLRADPLMGRAYDESPLFSEQETDRASFDKALLFARRTPFLFAGFWCLLALFAVWLQLPGGHF